MGKIGSIAIAVLALIAGYMAWDTARENPTVQAQARATACGEFSGCAVEAPLPHLVERNPFRHRYDWKTSLGPAIVECRRASVWFGEWTCGVDRTAVGAAGTEVGRYPVEQKRGSP